MKKKLPIIFVLLVVVILTSASVFSFLDKNKKLDVVIESDKEYKVSDVLAFSLDGIVQTGSAFPKRNDGYTFDSNPSNSYCENASVSFDPVKWKVTIKNLNGAAKCKINFKKSDVEIYAYTIDGKEQSGNYPEKGSNYYMTSATCSNGVKAVVDNSTWTVNVDSSKPTSCIVNFKTKKANPTLAEKILEDNPHVGLRTNFERFGARLNEGGLFIENRPGKTEGDKPVYYFS